ncbi:MAG TPA: 50S ribosomal protein L21 [Candidatus Omnitrophota bacterium]|nr:50S ribosomal protein L21 [Candidatus Omnitrophota bacterium]HPS36465.1 50S ribosomal protein L21 [Candidatus Omnitrophota bacterium]
MSNYAIIETGSKQYWVVPNQVIEVELLSAAEGQKEVTLDQVLLVQDGGNVKIGTPTVAGAKVVCENLGEMRGIKTVHYRMRRRKSSRRKRGHRQDLLRLRVKEIQAGK